MSNPAREMALLMRPETAHKLLYKLTCMDIWENPLEGRELESEIAHAYGEEISHEGPVGRVMGLVRTALGKEVPPWGREDFEIPEEWIRDCEIPHQQ